MGGRWTAQENNQGGRYASHGWHYATNIMASVPAFARSDIESGGKNGRYGAADDLVQEETLLGAIANIELVSGPDRNLPAWAVPRFPDANSSLRNYRKAGGRGRDAEGNTDHPKDAFLKDAGGRSQGANLDVFPREIFRARLEKSGRTKPRSVDPRSGRLRLLLMRGRGNGSAACASAP